MGTDSARHAVRLSRGRSDEPDQGTGGSRWDLNELERKREVEQVSLEELIHTVRLHQTEQGQGGQARRAIGKQQGGQGWQQGQEQQGGQPGQAQQGRMRQQDGNQSAEELIE